MSKYKSFPAKSFTARRKDLAKFATPGPGAYKSFSEFGTYHDNKFMEKFEKNEKNKNILRDQKNNKNKNTNTNEITNYLDSNGNDNRGYMRFFQNREEVIFFIFFFTFFFIRKFY